MKLGVHMSRASQADGDDRVLGDGEGNDDGKDDADAVGISFAGSELRPDEDDDEDADDDDVSTPSVGGALLEAPE